MSHSSGRCQQCVQQGTETRAYRFVHLSDLMHMVPWTTPLPQRLERLQQKHRHADGNRPSSTYLVSQEAKSNFPDQNDGDVIGIKLVSAEWWQKKSASPAWTLEEADSNKRASLKISTHAFGILNPSHPIRRLCLQLVSAPRFDKVVLVLILLNSVMLAAQDPQAEESLLTHSSELFFNLAFTIEMFIKMIALGVYSSQASYFRDSWNRFDFVTVLCGWLPFIICMSLGKDCFTPHTSGTINITFLRVVRVIKVLKSVQRIPSMRCLVLSLVKSAPLLVQVMEVLLFIFFCFGAIGVQLFAGKLRQRCFDEATGAVSNVEEICTEDPRLGGNQCGSDKVCRDRDFKGRPNTRSPLLNRYISFDDILLGFATVLSSASLEGWSQTMYSFMDAVGPIVCIYFILLVLIGSFFIVNLIVAVIYQAYVSEETGHISAPMQEERRRYRLDGQYADIEQRSLDRESWRPRPMGAAARSSILSEGQCILAGGDIPEARREGMGPIVETEQVKQMPFILVPDRTAEYIERHANAGEETLDGGWTHATARKLRSITMRGTLYWWALRDACCWIATRHWFDRCVMICIVFNTIVLLSEHDGQSGMQTKFACLANRWLTCFFVFEMVIRMLGTKYIFDPDDGKFNLFVAFITVGSVTDLIVESTVGRGSCGFGHNREFAGGDNKDANMVIVIRTSRVLRLVRIFRSLRIVRRWKSMSHILSAVVRSGPGLVNFSCLLSIFLWVYALAGMQMYAGRLTFSEGPSYIVRPRTNFDSLGSAILTVFIVVSGENWDEVLDLAFRANGYIGLVFIVSMYLIGNFIVLNIFLAILLSNFETAIDSSNRTLYDELEDANEIASMLRTSLHCFKRYCLRERSRRLVTAVHNLKGPSSIFPLKDSSNRPPPFQFPESSSSVSTIMADDRPECAHFFRSSGSFSKDAVSEGNCAEEGAEAGILDKSDDTSPFDSVIAGMSLETIADQMQDEINLRTYRRGRSEYHDCFTGSTAVDWMLEVGIADNLCDAVNICQDLLRARLIAATDLDACAREIRARKRGLMFSTTERGTHMLSNQMLSVQNFSSSAHATFCRTFDGRQTISGSATSKRHESCESPVSTYDLSRRSWLHKACSHCDEAQAQLNATPSWTAAIKSASTFRDNHQLYRFTARNVHRLHIIGDPETMRSRRKIQRSVSRSAAKMRMLSTRDSLFCFDTHNPIRLTCIDLVTHPYFDAVSFFLIVLSSLMLAATPPNPEHTTFLIRLLLLGDTVLTLCFLAELSLKMCAEGSLLYLQSGWNLLDFSIVAVSVVSLVMSAFASTGSQNLGYFKAIRAVRALRPLRMIHRYPAMKTVVDALMEAVPDVINVAFVVAGFFCMFATAGGTLFRGLLDYCHVSYKPRSECDDWGIECHYRTTPSDLNFAQVWARYRVDRSECRQYWKVRDQQDGGLPWSAMPTEYLSRGANSSSPLKVEWKPNDMNFDNLGTALLALFEISTLEGWPNFMFHAMDVTEDRSKHPRRNAAAPNAMFFVIFVIMGSLFVMNIFVGVVVHKFQVAKERTEGASVLLTDQQRALVDRIKVLLHMGGTKKLRLPDGSWRRWVFSIVTSECFEMAIICAIVLNMIAISLNHYDQSRTMDQTENALNITFAFVFFLELALKNLGLGLKQYWRDPWNRFDAFIVMTALFDAVTVFACSDIRLMGGFNLSTFRILRLVRVVKLINVNEGLKTLLKSLIVSLPSLFNVGSLLVLLIFVYACIGTNLYYDVEHDTYITKYCNFSTFGYSMLTLFRCLTGEDWNRIMIEIVNDDGRLSAYAFFSTFVILGNFMMLNLCVAVILEAFAEFMNADSEAELKRAELRQHAAVFKQAWLKHDVKDTLFIPKYRIVALLHDLPPPLGLPRTIISQRRYSRDSFHERQGGIALSDKRLCDEDVTSFGLSAAKERLSAYQRYLIEFVRAMRIKVNEDGELFYLDVLMAVLCQRGKDVDLTSIADDSTVELNAMLLRTMDARLRRKMQRHSFRHDLPELDLTHAVNAAVLLQDLFLSKHRKSAAEYAQPMK